MIYVARASKQAAKFAAAIVTAIAVALTCLPSTVAASTIQTYNFSFESHSFLAGSVTVTFDGVGTPTAVNQFTGTTTGLGDAPFFNSIYTYECNNCGFSAGSGYLNLDSLAAPDGIHAITMFFCVRSVCTGLWPDYGFRGLQIH
jgi:hypothetical protein